jgi:hypothetical protein
MSREFELPRIKGLVPSLSLLFKEALFFVSTKIFGKEVRLFC